MRGWVRNTSGLRPGNKTSPEVNARRRAEAEARWAELDPQVAQLVHEGKLNCNQIAEALEVGRSAVYESMKRQNLTSVFRRPKSSYGFRPGYTTRETLVQKIEAFEAWLYCAENATADPLVKWREIFGPVEVKNRW